MTSLVDLWRAVDPEARLLTSADGAGRVVVRGVARTRAAAPHLPPQVDGQLLVVDAASVAVDPTDRLMAAVGDAGLAPAAVLLAAVLDVAQLPVSTSAVPILVSGHAAQHLAAGANAYLADEASVIERFATELRLAGAEAALADPTPAAPAGLVAARLRRGVAVMADGELVALHARPAGQAIAARFSATVRARSLDAGTRRGGTRRTRDGLWLHEANVRPGASVWIFDDLPFAAVDMAGAAALTVTLRALLRRPAVAAGRRDLDDRQPPATGDVVTDTLLAVARANGRVATAARALGVHRNTVLYRLQRARLELGLDPRRPDDALRLLRSDEERRRR
ncbi:MAG: helix-turn-helix domain-containing protein [Chloroflexota bacterium]